MPEPTCGPLEVDALDAGRATSRAAPDEHLLAACAGYEAYDGVLVRHPPLDAARGAVCRQLRAVIDAHLGPDLELSTRAMIRAGELTELAPELSVAPRARELRTGRRALARLAFELPAQPAHDRAVAKAAHLAARGVPWVIAIDTARAAVLAWSTGHGGWRRLADEDAIAEPGLLAPLPVAALLGGEPARRAIAAVRAIAWRLGVVRSDVIGEPYPARADVLLAILAARDLRPDPATRARILRERDAARLLAWVRRAPTCTDLGELLGDPAAAPPDAR